MGRAIVRLMVVVPVRLLVRGRGWGLGELGSDRGIDRLLGMV